MYIQACSWSGWEIMVEIVAEAGMERPTGTDLGFLDVRLGVIRLYSGMVPGSDDGTPLQEFGGFSASSESSEHIPAKPQ